MHEILLKAYADGIVQSLKERYNDPGHGPVPFAAVDLGEETNDGDVHSVQVKFFWEMYSSMIGSYERSYQTVLHVNGYEGMVSIDYTDEWGYLTPLCISSHTDWLTQAANKAAND
jgi:hypothetical protein